MNAVAKDHGANKWVDIASRLPGRNSRQCKDRYILDLLEIVVEAEAEMPIALFSSYFCFVFEFRWQVLNQTFMKVTWTDAEDRAVIDMHRRLGNKWAEMAKFLPGR